MIVQVWCRGAHRLVVVSIAVFYTNGHLADTITGR
jgi:hypothetical protein